MFVHGEQALVVLRSRNLHFLYIHPLLPAAMAQTLPSPGSIDEDASHRFARGGEKLSPALPMRLRVRTQAQPGFMNERCRLKSLSGGFMRHLCCGHAAQFFIDERKNAVGRALTAFLRSLEDFGQFAHDAES
jgi:hypothetical protein